MSFSDKMLTLRKKQKLSQEALAKELGATTTTIGRYERGEVKPSIEVAAKIAEVLNVSLDFMVGNTTNNFEDKSMLNRFNQLLELKPEDKNNIIITLDALLRDAKARQAYT
jgi:transcriptional regulator with XRE-family HTH domain